MKILAFDTSNTFASVAISNDKAILAYIEELRPSMQAERLLPMIEEALAYAKLSYNDIDYLGVINGPGSFTGIRTGLSAAMGISVGTKIKVIAISNFEILHYLVLNQIKSYDKIFIILNAYRDQLYIQCFNKNKSFDEASIIDITSAIDLFSKDDGNIIVCSGNGVKFIYDKIKSVSNITILPRFTNLKALYICKCIYNNLPYYLNRPIAPLYIRLPDAKI